MCQKLVGISPLKDPFPHKDWQLKKETKVYPRFLIEKKSGIPLFFYLHFN
jgi:hypothetical protein